MSGGYGGGGGSAAPPLAINPEKEQLQRLWADKFNQAQQADSWGQVVEAQEGYNILASQMAAKAGLAIITSKEKENVQRLVNCLSARVFALKNCTLEGLTAADMAPLKSVFDQLFTGVDVPFPIDTSKYRSVAPVKPSTEGEIICGDTDEPYSDWQVSQAVLKNVSGTVISIRIDKIGLKDAQDYIDPTMTILIADPRTYILDTHDTPVAKERRATHVIFNHQVYLNISFEDMERQKAALFFEFKHYKPKKKKVSTRCWAFMELNELKPDEEIVLELYHKPTDLKKKKLKLHTEKQLYLHLMAQFIKNDGRA